MNLNLTLPSDLGSQLSAKAGEQGIEPEELALALLTKAIVEPSPTSDSQGEGWFATHVYDDPH